MLCILLYMDIICLVIKYWATTINPQRSHTEYWIRTEGKILWRSKYSMQFIYVVAGNLEQKNKKTKKER